MKSNAFLGERLGVKPVDEKREWDTYFAMVDRRPPITAGMCRIFLKTSPRKDTGSLRRRASKIGGGHTGSCLEMTQTKAAEMY